MTYLGVRPGGAAAGADEFPHGHLAADAPAYADEPIRSGEPPSPIR